MPVVMLIYLACRKVKYCFEKVRACSIKVMGRSQIKIIGG